MGNDTYAKAPNTAPFGGELELQSNDADKSFSAVAREGDQGDDKVYIKGARFWLIFTTFV